MALFLDFIKVFRSFFTATLLLLFTYSKSQTNFTLSGYILDESSKEVIIGSNIIIPSLKTGTISNSYGFYSITVPKGNYDVIFNVLGYKEVVKKIIIDRNISFDILLSEQIEELSEVIITENIENIEIDLPVLSLNRLSGQTIKQTPVVFGESDLLKTIQLLPGVSNAGEGASGFNVRGGAADQNLILFDEAIIYNSSHLFGLFSVFNSDAIKEVKLFKGGIPAS